MEKTKAISEKFKVDFTLSISVDASDVPEAFKSNIEVSTFSYSEHAEIYKDNNPGVKHDGFKNINEQKISNAKGALERAKNECTIEWDSFGVSFDNESTVWMVSFYTEGMLGGDQVVYLDGNGKTLLIVYGE